MMHRTSITRKLWHVHCAHEHAIKCFIYENCSKFPSELQECGFDKWGEKETWKKLTYFFLHFILLLSIEYDCSIECEEHEYNTIQFDTCTWIYTQSTVILVVSVCSVFWRQFLINFINRFDLLNEHHCRRRFEWWWWCNHLAAQRQRQRTCHANSTTSWMAKTNCTCNEW